MRRVAIGRASAVPPTFSTTVDCGPTLTTPAITGKSFPEMKS